MLVKEKQVGDVTVVEFQDQLDASVAREFKEKMGQIINEGRYTLVLDLNRVTFIDSSGLGAIVSCLKLLGHRGEVVICGVKAPVINLFQLTRMDKVFQMFDDQSQALEALADYQA